VRIKESTEERNREKERGERALRQISAFIASYTVFMSVYM
jgi:hypothetical protein